MNEPELLIEITVTAEHVAAAKVGAAYCPVAQALRAATGEVWNVGYSTAQLNGEAWELDVQARLAVHEYDRTKTLGDVPRKVTLRRMR
jgi:hypothetical protein